MGQLMCFWSGALHDNSQRAMAINDTPSQASK